MGTEEPRNLLLNWCERGASFAEAASQLRDVTPWWDSPDFEDRGSDEYRAFGLVNELNGDNPPGAFFPVSLEIDWAAPFTKKNPLRARWRAVTERARDEASRGDLSDTTRDELQAVFPSLKVGAPRHDEARSGFGLVSWSARVKSSGGRPYLERLTKYLRESERGGHHMRKLEREAEATGADRLHLYLLVASTGAWGNLLASSPSYLTEGMFAPPKSLTDVWLDGGNGYVYRWQRESGWTYHEND